MAADSSSFRAVLAARCAGASLYLLRSTTPDERAWEGADYSLVDILSADEFRASSRGTRNSSTRLRSGRIYPPCFTLGTTKATSGKTPQRLRCCLCCSSSHRQPAVPQKLLEPTTTPDWTTHACTVLFPCVSFQFVRGGGSATTLPKSGHKLFPEQPRVKSC